jgi:hypothetical protein
MNPRLPKRRIADKAITNGGEIIGSMAIEVNIFLKGSLM